MADRWRRRNASPPSAASTASTRRNAAVIRADALTEAGRYDEALRAWEAAPRLPEERPEQRELRKLVCRAGLGKDYIEVMHEMRQLIVKHQVVGKTLKDQAAVYALAAAAALHAAGGG